jgi:propionaldehyde dehydrogenase
MTAELQVSEIESIIRKVMAQVNGAPQGVLPRAAQYRGVFPTVDEAVNAAQASLAKFRKVSLTQRKAIIQAMRETVIDNAQKLAQMAVDETKMGRVSDKTLKNLLVAEKTPGVEILPNIHTALLLAKNWLC